MRLTIEVNLDGVVHVHREGGNVTLGMALGLIQTLVEEAHNAFEVIQANLGGQHEEG